MAPGHASLVWLRHVLDVEEATRGKKRCFISFEAVLSDWRAAMTRIQDVLGFDWPRPLIDAQEEIDAFLDNQLWHHRHASLELAEKSIVKQWVKAVYRASLRLANDPTDKKACATLDRTREAFDRVVATVGDATISRLSLRERRVGSILGDDALIDTIHASNQRVSALALERSNLRQEMHGLRGDIEAGDRKIADLARERKLLEDRITQLHNSTSWRITAPLRMVGRLVRRIGAHASV